MRPDLSLFGSSSSNFVALLNLLKKIQVQMLDYVLDNSSNNRHAPLFDYSIIAFKIISPLRIINIIICDYYA